MEARLDVAMDVSTPAGPLHLNQAPYMLGAETLGSTSVTHRRTEATNPFVEGAYTVNALRENVTTPVSIWVRASTPGGLGTALEALTSAFDQSMFIVDTRVVDWTMRWQCFASDYSIGLQREFLHATVALVDVQLVHHPGAPGWTNLFSDFGANG